MSRHLVLQLLVGFQGIQLFLDRREFGFRALHPGVGN
jgi:hypothetical protein